MNTYIDATDRWLAGASEKRPAIPRKRIAASVREIVAEAEHKTHNQFKNFYDQEPK